MSNHKDITSDIEVITKLMEALESKLVGCQDEKYNGKIMNNWKRCSGWITKRIENHKEEKKDSKSKSKTKKESVQCKYIYSKQHSSKPGERCSTKTRNDTGYCACHRYSKQAREEKKE